MASGLEPPESTICGHVSPPPQGRAAATVRVLLPLPLADAYDYRVPEGMTAEIGRFVVVPLGRILRLGVVWGAGTGEVAPERLRDIEAVLDCLPMAETTRRFVDWVASYTLSSPGSVLRMAMSVPSALEPPKTEIVYCFPEAGRDPLIKLTPARKRVLAQLEEGPFRIFHEVREARQWLDSFPP